MLRADPVGSALCRADPEASRSASFASVAQPLRETVEEQPDVGHHPHRLGRSRGRRAS